MKSFPLISTVIMVVGLVAAIFISTKMMDMRKDMYKSTPARLELTYMPILGIDKFYADVKWIELLQHMGDPEVKMREDEQGREVAEFYYQMLDDITNRSPDTAKFYQVGSMHIQNVQPEMAIKLLVKGNEVSTKKDWHRPHIAAFISDRFIAARATDESKRTEALKQAAAFYRQALDMGGTPEYVETAWLRKQAEIEGFADDPLKMLIAEKTYLDSKLREMADTMETDPEGGEGAVEDTAMYMDMSDDGRIEKIRERVIERCQKLALETWQEMQSGKAAKDAEKQMARVKKIFFEVAPAGHYSVVSLRPYDAGVFYDPITGTPVKPYGISFAAWKDHKIVAPFKGSYCHITGQSREEAEKAWEKWWAENQKDGDKTAAEVK